MPRPVGKATWVHVTDAAGVERFVRPIDAKEIAAVAAGATPNTPEVEVAEMVEVDDQSVAPKASKKK